jgi:hypothetical protein
VTGHSGASAAGAPKTLVEEATAHRAPPGLAAAVATADGAAGLATSGLADVRTGRPVTSGSTQAQRRASTHSGPDPPLTRNELHPIFKEEP